MLVRHAYVTIIDQWKGFLSTCRNELSCPGRKSFMRMCACTCVSLITHMHWLVHVQNFKWCLASGSMCFISFDQVCPVDRINQIMHSIAKCQNHSGDSAMPFQRSSYLLILDVLTMAWVCWSHESQTNHDNSNWVPLRYIWWPAMPHHLHFSAHK